MLLDRNRLDGLVATLKRGCMDGIDVDHEPVMNTSRARKAPMRFRELHRVCRGLCGLSQADLGAFDSIIAQ